MPDVPRRTEGGDQELITRMKPTWRKVYNSRGSRVTIENGQPTQHNPEYCCIMVNPPAPFVMHAYSWLAELPEAYAHRTEQELN